MPRSVNGKAFSSNDTVIIHYAFRASRQFGSFSFEEVYHYTCETCHCANGVKINTNSRIILNETVALKLSQKSLNEELNFWHII